MKYIDADKLKAEIERRMTENYELAEKADEAFGQRAVEDNDILALIASLRQEQPEVDLEKETEESEKPINPDDAMEELNEKIALVKQKGTWDGVDVDKYMDEVRGREPENPMDLEEEIKRFVAEYGYERSEDILLIAIVARQFYELGCCRAAEKYNEIEYNRQRAEESVPNDLEKAAKEYAKTTFKKPYSDNPDEEVTIVEPDKYAGFIAGAKWDRSQMMKEAVEGTVMDFSSNQPRPQVDVLLDPHKYHTGDKVRIIIVKED